MPWREAAISECDYSFRAARHKLKRPVDGARGWMLRTQRWKYILFEFFRPQLFDLRKDPHELVDLGRDRRHAKICAELHERLFAWLRARKIRVTLPNELIERSTNTHKTSRLSVRRLVGEPRQAGELMREDSRCRRELKRRAAIFFAANNPRAIAPSIVRRRAR